MGLFSQTKLYEAADKMSKINESRVFKLVLDKKLVRDLIIFMNTEDQFGRKHVDSKGEQLFNNFTNRTTYSLFNKKKGGKPYEIKDTGDYWKSFEVKITGDEIIIDSDPQKEDTNLFVMYTPEIEGLTDENKQRLIDLAKELYVAWLRKNMV